MKKFTIGKLLAAIVVLVLIGGVLFFANAFLGNPISYALVKGASARYVEETYGGTDIEITDIGYDFKSSNYYVHAKSASSIDTNFSIYYSMLGKLQRDSYESSVLDKWNTFMRLGEAFNKDVRALLDELPYDYDMYGATIDSPKDEQTEFFNSMYLDMPYERAQMNFGRAYIHVYIFTENRTMEEVLRVLREIDAHLLASGVANLGTYTLQLEAPIPENGEKDFDSSIGVLDFDRELLYADDVLELMAENWRIANIVDKDPVDNPEADTPEAE